MPDPQHNELAGAQLHPSHAGSFTGPTSGVTPTAASQLYTKTDVTPNELYRSTGTTAGALVLVGGGPAGAAATISIGTVEPDSAGVTVANRGTSSAAVLDFDLTGLDPEPLKLLVENAYTGTSHTLALIDLFRGVTMNNANPNTVFIPLDSTVSIPVWSQSIVHPIGAGQTSITAVSGVTLNGVDGGTVVIAERWSAVTLWKRGTNIWSAIGGIE
jgi:hypothetical protein